MNNRTTLREKRNKPMWRTDRNAVPAAAAMACATLALCAPAHALGIDTDIPDLQIRWDTRIGYTLGFRTERPVAALSEGVGVVSFNDGDLNFSKRTRPITNRFDVFSEADLKWRAFGARVSAAGWFDEAYHRGTTNSTSLVTFPPPRPFNQATSLNSGSPGSFTEATRKLHGEKAELLDAFVFGKFDIGSMPLNVRLGRHGLVWGESLFFGVNGIAAGMAPVDVIKLQSSPNATVKEIIRPVGQLSGQLQVSQAVSLGAYLQYDWQKTRLPASGSFYSTNDTIDTGGERLAIPAGPGGTIIVANRGEDKPARNSGQGGVQAHFRVPGSDTDFGLYAIRFHSKTPAVYLDGSGALPTYRLVYAEKINAFAASLNTTIGALNLGSEVSLRTHSPLGRGLISLPGGPLPFDGSSNPAYPIGRTAHVNVSALYSLPETFVAREASVAAEVAWNRVLSCQVNCVNLPPSAAFPRGFSPRDANAERDAWGWRMVFTPTYRQVFNGVDVAVPIGLSYSPKGKSGALGPVMVNNGGDMSIGINATVREAFTFAMNFTHYYGKSQPTVDGAGFFNFGQSLGDRDNLTLSVKYAF